MASAPVYSARYHPHDSVSSVNTRFPPPPVLCENRTWILVYRAIAAASAISAAVLYILAILLDGIWISTSDPGCFVSQWQLLLSALTLTIWATTAALLLSGPPKRIHQRMILALGASILALRFIAIVISAYVSGLALLIELPLVLIDTMYAIPFVATWKAYTPVGERLLPHYYVAAQ